MSRRRKVYCELCRDLVSRRAVLMARLLTWCAECRGVSGQSRYCGTHRLLLEKMAPLTAQLESCGICTEERRLHRAAVSKAWRMAHPERQWSVQDRPGRPVTRPPCPCTQCIYDEECRNRQLGSDRERRNRAARLTRHRRLYAETGTLAGFAPTPDAASYRRHIVSQLEAGLAVVLREQTPADAKRAASTAALTLLDLLHVHGTGVVTNPS